MRKHLSCLWLGLSLALVASGCVYRTPNIDQPSHCDAVFHQRQPDPAIDTCCDPMLAAARELTVIEDDLRRDGTITVKTPDVWGDGNLMYFIQEFDRLMTERTKKFDETLQAFVARSDIMELQTAMGVSASFDDNATSGTTNTNTNTNTVATPTQIEIPTITPFDLIKTATGAAPAAVAKTTGGIGVEPTELARQHATYIDVCQSLRRRHMGDDNSRAAGYGLYKFRVPVSILPGRETKEGFSAVLTMRAQLRVDEAHLRYTYPKLVIADLVDQLTPLILSNWETKAKEKTPAKPDLCTISQALETLSLEDVRTPALQDAAKAGMSSVHNFINAPNGHKLQDDKLVAALKVVMGSAPSIESLTPAQRVAIATIEKSVVDIETKRGANPVLPTSPDAFDIFGQESVLSLRDLVQEAMKLDLEYKGKPKPQEVRGFLFRYLGQVEGTMEANDEFCSKGPEIILLGKAVAKNDRTTLSGLYATWTGEARADAGTTTQRDADLKETIATKARVYAQWLIALQTGIMEVNLGKILEHLALQNKLSPDQVQLACSDDFRFFDVAHNPDARRITGLWQKLVREEFPLHVFALDPQVEEQNVYDAFSRRREMQMALAISVARGRIGAQQKVALSRQLALDDATIALNRMVVGFSHGDDTFGWYFYPRIQSPPTEASNIAALARLVWSGGPTRHYDTKHQKLEPGMRECEVLVAMPSFVTQVAFDVTTNWERLTVPGTSKRSYEAMLVQGSRIQHLKEHLLCAANDGCYRPGDYDRLASRVTQLEAMLGMQTHLVSIPYEYEQSGSDLFDTGDLHLRPVITGYYGLQYLDAPTTGASPGGGASTAAGSVGNSVTVNVTAPTPPPSGGSGGGGDAAHVFLTGKNFHPTLTHVIVGGAESHSLGGSDTNIADVEVINRQLIKVKINKLNGKLSNTKVGFEVRVGTPAGLSNPIVIGAAGTPPDPKGFSFPADLLYSAHYCGACSGRRRLCLSNPSSSSQNIQIVADVETPLPCRANLLVRLTGTLKDGTPLKFDSHGLTWIDVPVNGTYTVAPSATAGGPLNRTICVPFDAVRGAIHTAFDDHEHSVYGYAGQSFDLTITGYLTFDGWPAEKTRNSFKIHVEPCDKDCKGCDNTVGSAASAPTISEPLPAPTSEPTPALLPPQGPADNGAH